MKYFFYLPLIVLLISCGTPSSNTNMTVNGSVEGLRKGTLYLQKLQDTAFISIDSFTVKGNEDFMLGANIESAEIYFLSLQKGAEDSLMTQLPFFAEKGEITINTQLKTFVSSAEISGSENQVLWEEYQDMIRQFNTKSLELLEDYVKNEEQYNPEDKEANFEERSNRLLKRKYLFALNFANNNKDKVIAPYIGRYEIAQANPKLLDTLYANLSEEVKRSTYGKALSTFLLESKEAATQQ